MISNQLSDTRLQKVAQKANLKKKLREAILPFIPPVHFSPDVSAHCQYTTMAQFWWKVSRSPAVLQEKKIGQYGGANLSCRVPGDELRPKGGVDQAVEEEVDGGVGGDEDVGDDGRHADPDRQGEAAVVAHSPHGQSFVHVLGGSMRIRKIWQKKMMASFFCTYTVLDFRDFDILT